jgi:hypothetical protein
MKTYKRVVLPEKYREPFLRKLDEFRQKQSPSWTKKELAKWLEIDPSHLTKLYKGNLKLSVTYVLPAILRGILKTEDIFMVGDLNKENSRAWEILKLAENKGFLDTASRLKREKGIDPIAVLEATEKKDVNAFLRAIKLLE